MNWLNNTSGHFLTFGVFLEFQDYTQNIHGKEIDLLRVTVKVPGKRPPRAVAPAGPSPVPPGSGVNGLSKDLTAADSTSTGTSSRVHSCHNGSECKVVLYFPTIDV